jgi:hypothetical protein
MTTGIQNQITVTTNPTFAELFVASLTLIRYQGWLIILHTVFPLAGLFMISTPLMGYRLGPVEILIALLAFSFTPLITALALWLSRRRNKLATGPFTYVFDSEGVHTSGSTFSQTIKWSAIPRVRQSKRFLFVFLGPARAHCIPLGDVGDVDALDRLRALASENTSFR